jgi:hypothetical protein
MPSGVTQFNPSTCPPGADLAADFCQAASESEFKKTGSGSFGLSGVERSGMEGSELA